MLFRILWDVTGDNGVEGQDNQKEK